MDDYKHVFFLLEPQLIAKSNIILDVKPWDDETDMKKLEEAVRAVTTDGLIWGACKYYVLLLMLNKLHSVCDIALLLHLLVYRPTFSSTSVCSPRQSIEYFLFFVGNVFVFCTYYNKNYMVKNVSLTSLC